MLFCKGLSLVVARGGYPPVVAGAPLTAAAALVEDSLWGSVALGHRLSCGGPCAQLLLRQVGFSQRGG